MTNGDVITLVNLIRNKNSEGEDMTDSEWSALITANSQRLFAKLLGVPNLYQLRTAQERRGAELSREISHKLRPFYIRESANVVGGAVDFSTKNIAYGLAIEPSSISGRGFDELEPSEVADRLGSAVVSPTVNDPCYEWKTGGDGILVYPSSLSTVVLKYYTYPTDAVVVHTTNSTTLLKSYDSGSSTETGWQDNELIEIAYMCLADLGINMERADVTQYAQMVEANG